MNRKQVAIVGNQTETFGQSRDPWVWNLLDYIQQIPGIDAGLICPEGFERFNGVVYLVVWIADAPHLPSEKTIKFSSPKDRGDVQKIVDEVARLLR